MHFYIKHKEWERIIRSNNIKYYVLQQEFRIIAFNMYIVTNDDRFRQTVFIKSKYLKP